MDAEDASVLRERYRALLLANSNGDDARTGGPKGRTWGGGDPNSEAEDSDSDAAEVDHDSAKVQTFPIVSCLSQPCSVWIPGTLCTILSCKVPSAQTVQQSTRSVLLDDSW